MTPATLAQRASYSIGAATVHPSRMEIESSGNTTRIQPRTMALLTVIFDGNGAVVSRSELSERIWGADGASDELIARHVSYARAALGANKSLLATVPKVGYRIRLNVDAHAPGANAPADTPAEQTPVQAPTLRPWLLVTAAALGVAIVAAAFLGDDRAALPITGAPRPLLDTDLQVRDLNRSASGPIAFISVAARSNAGPVMLLDSGQQLSQIAAGYNRLPSLSPNADMIGYFHYTDAGCQLIVRRLESPDAIATLPCRDMQTSPIGWFDASSILYLEHTSDGEILRRFNLSSRETTDLIMTTPQRRLDFPVRTATGIALLEREHSGRSRLLSLPVQGAKPQVILDSENAPVRWMGPGLTADSLLLIRRDDRHHFVPQLFWPRSGKIHSLEVGDSTQSALIGDSKLAYAAITYRREHHLAMRRITGDFESAKIQLPDRRIARVAISPDGERLAYIADASRGAGVFVADASITPTSNLLYSAPGGARLGPLSWSRDSQLLYFIQYREAETLLVRCQTDSGESQAWRLDSPAIAAQERDSEQVWLYTRRGSGLSIDSFELTTRKISETYFIEAAGGQFMADNARFFAMGTSGELQQYVRADHQLTLQARLPTGAGHFFTLAGERLYAPCRNDEASWHLCELSGSSWQRHATLDISNEPVSVNDDGSVMIASKILDLRLQAMTSDLSIR